jgi:hypothetical protein
MYELRQKMSLASFRAILSQTHLVTLIETKCTSQFPVCLLNEGVGDNLGKAGKP